MIEPQTLKPLVVVLAAYWLLALAYTLVLPLWEAPDGIWHYEFAAHLARGGGLPTRADEGIDAAWRQQGSQPPLYYLLTAPLIAAVDPTDADSSIRFNPHAAVGVAGPEGNVNRMVHGEREAWPWKGTVLAARLMGIAGLLLGTVAVVATWALGRATFPSRPAVAAAAAAVLALSPEFLFFSGAISNDVAAAATGAITLWLVVEVVRRGPRPVYCALLGAAVGAAALSKLSGAWLIPVAGLGTLWSVRLHGAEGDVGTGNGSSRAGPAPLREFVHRAARPVMAFALAAALVGGWWYARNLLLFGDATGLPLMLNVMTPRAAPPTFAELAQQLVAVWKSYWAVFGWFNVPAPDWVYVLVTIVSGSGVAGLATLAVLGRIRPSGGRAISADEARGLVVAVAAVATMFVALFVWAQLRYPQGRLLFPSGPALALIVGAGWTAWLQDRSAIRMAAALGAGMAGLSVYLLFVVVGPAYGHWGLGEGTGGWVRSEAQSEAGNCTRLDRVVFADSLALRMFCLDVQRLDDRPAEDPDAPAAGEGAGRVGEARPRNAAHSVHAAHPGDALHVGLFWEPLMTIDVDYSVYIHLVDDNGRIIAQRDSYPGSGNWPTGGWAPGAAEWFHDPHVLVIPRQAEAPVEARVLAGVYDHRTGDRLVTGAGTGACELGTLEVVPRVGPDGVPSPLEVAFGDEIVLVGYRISDRDVAPGHTIDLTLYWRADEQLERDYKVSVQLRSVAGEKWGQRDEEPADGAMPTSDWVRGAVGADHQPVHVYDDAPAGDHRLYVKLYDPEAATSLPVDYHGWEVDLGRITVTGTRGR